MKNFIEIIQNQIPVASINIVHIVSFTVIEDNITGITLSAGETMTVPISYDELKKLIEAAL